MNTAGYRVRVINGDFFSITEGDGETHEEVGTLCEAVKSAREFLADTAEAAQCGNLAERYSVSDIEIVGPDGAVYSIEDAEALLSAGTTAPRVAKNFRKTYQRDGVTLSVAVSSCCWMYPNYPFQIHLLINETGVSAISSRRGLSFQDATEADVDALVASMAIVKCPRCGHAMFEYANTPDGNPAKVCSKCVLDDLQSQAQRRQEATDIKMKADGYRFRVNAYIHPAAGGDDYPVVFYATIKPTAQIIRAELKKHGSEVFDDYTITRI